MITRRNLLKGAAATALLPPLARSHASEVAYQFEIIVKDSQSNPNRAAEVAQELIIDDEVDLMMVASTPKPVHAQPALQGVQGIAAVRLRGRRAWPEVSGWR